MTEVEAAIEKALNEDAELSREEYAEKKAKADEVTAAHGVEGEAPLNEEERERRMRMNFYGSVLNIGMAILAALDDMGNNLATLTNLVMAGGTTDGGNDHPNSGD